MFKRLLAIVLLCSVTFTSTACIGRMAVAGKVMELNLALTENKWGREGIFLLFRTVLPVYWFAGVIDLLIVNSIEFWTGTNPVSGQKRLAMVGDQKYVRADDGTEAISTLKADGSIDIEIHAADGSLHHVNVMRQNGAVIARDVEGNQIALVDERTGEIRTFAREARL